MTKKEVLRTIWVVVSYGSFFGITVEFLLGKADTLTIILMIIGYAMIALCIILKIVNIVASYIVYRDYRKDLEYLKDLNKQRYKIYFTGNKERLEEYSAEIERYGRNILNSGESHISQTSLTKKYSQKIQEILEEVEEIINDGGLG